SRRCALFTTYDLLMVHYNAMDDEVWRQMHKTEYWGRDVWVLPIHQSSPVEHWVLCTVSLNMRELFLYDSFAEASPWKHEVSEIICLVARLVLLANANGYPLHIVTEEG
ncbi:hypothetical protein BDZ94DRAFT_1134099, partial [Collybia nuda]